MEIFVLILKSRMDDAISVGLFTATAAETNQKFLAYKWRITCYVLRIYSYKICVHRARVAYKLHEYLK